MPWKYGNVTLKEGVGFTAGSIKHPANWNVWTDTYKKDVIGLTWSDSPKPYDSEYYYGWNSDESALLPKPIADLKTIKLSNARTISKQRLSETDWYVTRKYERDVAIPSELSAYRTAVLTNYTSLQNAINSASDVDALKLIYTHTAGASSVTKTINAHSSDVVSTSNNTITISGHGFVDDEEVKYSTGGLDAIGGLVNGQSYFIISKTDNNFKLSESHTNCGDAAAISLTALAPSNGTAHTLTSLGKPSKGQTWPNPHALKYDGS